MSNNITCTCGHSWNKSSSSKKDMRICHICGKDNTMKNGGWLDAYDEEMQLGGNVYPANYVPQAENGIEGTMGGLTDQGFNYNGAWGGTMEYGGDIPQAQNGIYGGLNFLEPTSKKLPAGYNPKEKGSSTEYATSIGGTDGELAYLIPEFKYGKLLDDPKTEFKRTGDYLGGPFKTHQEADQWERDVRHPYVEKGQSIPTPLRRWGKDFEDGGNVPQAQLGEIVPASFPLGDLAIKAASKVADWFSSDKPKPKTKPTRRPSSSSEDDNKTELLQQIINIKDPRKIRKTTGQPINPNVDLVSGEYDAYLIKEALQDAKNYGLSKEDAWNLAAIDFQETGWGKTDSNMGHVLAGSQGGDTENSFLNAYLNKMKEADRLKITDPEMRLQVYNGLGFIKPETEQNYHGFKMKKIYGVPVPKEGLSMKKNPLYGKQIIDLRDNVLKQNPDITSYIESLYGEEDDAPKKAMGGNIPGSVGFTYARTKGIPSEGPYAKKTLASAQNGHEMSFYQNGLDWTPRNISRDGSEIKKDDNGYWNPENWGKPVEIGSNNITMQGVNQPLIGISDEGDVQYMEPGEDYKFKGKKVTEYPMAEDGYTGSSVVDYLSTKGLSSTKSARKELAREFNVDDYDYSSGKNLELLEKLRNSDEKLNKMKKDYTPISIERLEQMLGKKQDKKAPSPAPSYNAPKKPINKAMLDLMMMQPSFNPNIEKPALNLADATTVSVEEIPSIQTPFGIDPSAWNTSGFNPRIGRSQPSGAPLPQIDTDMIWNTSGISPRVFDQQEENSSLPNIDFNQAWNTSGTSPRNINTQQPFSTVPTPLWRSDAAPIPNTQGAPFSTVPNPLWGNNPQVNQPANDVANVVEPATYNPIGIPGLPLNIAKDIYKYGPSLAKRMASMLIGDDESTISKPLAFKKLPVVNNKEEFSKKEFDESPFDPITTGNIRSDEHDTEHRGPGFYHTNEMIDLDKFKFGFHNREGQGSTTDKFNVTKTEGLVIPVFNKEYGYDDKEAIDAEGTRSIRKYKDSEIKDTKLYGGVDDKGKFYLDYGKNLKGKNLTMADFRYIDATGFAKDADGNFVLGNETSNNKIAKVPHLINTKGKEEHLNILVPKLGKDQHLKYGDTTGGRMILTTPDMKHKFLASGSLQDLNDTLEEFKKRFKTESVRVVVLDNGTFSRGLRKTNKKIYKNDWKKYDEANDQGGAGFYYYKDGGEVKPTTGWLDKYN